MSLAKRANLRPPPQPISAAEFETMIKAHETYVSGRTGVGAIIPRFLIARGMQCDGRQLMDADFNSADLTQTSFVGANLTRASFYCATLIRCDLRRAVLRRADLRGAALAGAQLAGANLDDAEMRAAVLVTREKNEDSELIGVRADLQGSTLDGAQLDELVAEGVNFSNCSLRGAKLRNANLANANLANANLEGADLDGARLVGVTLKGAVLSGVDLSRLDLPPETLIGCVTDPSAQAYGRAADIRTVIAQAELWVQTEGAQGARGVLDGLDIRVVADAFRDRALTGLSASGAIGVSVDFSGAQLQGAVFDGADLRRANFQNTDLRGASFVGAKLAHADFANADTGALMLPSGRNLLTRFEGASLHGTGLSATNPANELHRLSADRR